MKKTTFQIFISQVLPSVVGLLGGATLLWDTFSKYSHVFSKTSSLILAIVFLLLPICTDLLLSKRPLEWVFKDGSSGKIKGIKSYWYLFSWFFAAAFNLYYFTYNPYKGISQSSEDVTINLIKSLKEKPFFLTGFFLPTNAFVDSAWRFTRDHDTYYQGLSVAEDPYTYVNDFEIREKTNGFFSSNAEERTMKVIDIDTLVQNNDTTVTVETQRVDSIHPKTIEYDKSKYQLYFTYNFLKNFLVLERANNVNLPKKFRELLERFEKIKAESSFSYVSREKKDFIIISNLQDSFNVGNPWTPIDKLPLISIEDMQTLYSFSVVMVELYNETNKFIKARDIIMDLNKIQYINFSK